jgi:creatinine amidohydrolase
MRLKRTPFGFPNPLNLDAISSFDMADTAQGYFLEHLSWKDAETVLTERSVVVIPIGAQAKQHGHHLPLNNDFLIADYLRNAIVKRLPVVVAPTINYSYYPAMAEYPGTVSLSCETASRMFTEIVRSFARFGPRHFYFLNTGISTIEPVQLAADALHSDNVNVAYTDLRIALKTIRSDLEEQKGGTHADEIETSIMLFIAPEVVRMAKASRDFTGDGPGPLSRAPRPDAVHSPTGAWGDPTLATREKGEAIIRALIDGIADDINGLFNQIASISNRI